MTCLYSNNGQKLCNVVEHPERTNETFCATCQRRFIKREYGFDLAILLILVTGLLLLIAGNRPVRVGASIGENDLPPLPEDVASGPQQPEDGELIAQIPLPPR